MAVAITTTQRGSTPIRVLPFAGIAAYILGKEYELSIVFVGEKRSRTINRTYRHKDKATNVLSFPLSPKSGELVLCMPIVKKECVQFERTEKQHLLMLFIHGLLHLKGLDHGSTMESEERRVAARFGYTE